MAKVKGKKSTTTALYNLRKKEELAKKMGNAPADRAERQRHISEMNRRSAQIKADIKKRTDNAKAKAKKPDTSKLQKAAYIPTNKQVKARSSKQRAAIAIKYKKK